MSKAKIYLKELSDQFKRTQKALQAWSQADTPNIAFDGGVVKGISESLRFEWQRLIDASADDGREVEDKAKRVVMALDDFALKFARWMRAAAVQADSPRGSVAMWEAWERVEAAFMPVNQSIPKPVKYLVDVANAPREQIARKYGWIDEHGEPDLLKVQEEYETPGKHFDNETWTSPVLKSYYANINRQWPERVGSRKPLFSTMNELDPEQTATPRIAWEQNTNRH
ncbi:hypothetical protein VN12_04000 [Pirellula sp. SH-Sr6A]|uniref:hypothetical protein n=1 Tax=Pirellula sp. SH-Sr6A TaxID=1632865 RepID=UPI00078DA626|nr:hypothetical protein [Pirellula sp. SH-Sr6A]AMV31257.1 hypothetical protein VN12_04000 [Pirellula sp. SH-Sr6A]